MTDTADVSVDQIEADFVPRRRREVPSVEIDGDAVIYDEVNEATHLLNPTGALIWSLLDGTASLGEIASELATAFGAPADAVLPDLLSLVRDLGRKGLLEHVRAEPTAH